MACIHDGALGVQVLGAVDKLGKDVSVSDLQFLSAECAGGVHVTAHNGRIIVDNTLERCASTRARATRACLCISGDGVLCLGLALVGVRGVLSGPVRGAAASSSRCTTCSPSFAH